MPIEKVYLPKEARTVKKKDGTTETKIVQPWEIRATGKEVQELRGAFKDSAPQMMHEGWKEWNDIGETTITKPDGSTDVVRADKEPMYRAQPGFCERRVRPGVTVSGFGSMKRDGVTRFKASYSNGVRTVLEER